MTKAALRRMVVVLVVVVVTLWGGSLSRARVLPPRARAGRSGGSFAWEVNVASLVLKSEAGCHRMTAFLYVAEHNNTERRC